VVFFFINFVLLLYLIIDVLFLFIASPLNDRDNRWNLLHDDEGKAHLIDANPVQDDAEPFFNAEADTRFVLFTRNNPTNGQTITWDANSIRNSNFNANHPVRITIHGWNSGLGSGVNTATRASYLQIGNFNVIQVDWSVGAGTVNYITARNRVGAVGDVVARLINFLVDQGFVPSVDRISIAGRF
jgi:pancreatic triacylglycerol lipase